MTSMTPARLRRRDLAPRLVLHDRGDYVFYGVEVPIAGTFRDAKERELALAALGFVESRVVPHRPAGALAAGPVPTGGLPDDQPVLLLAAAAKRAVGGAR